MHGNGTSLLSCLKCQQERASVGERSTNHINWHGSGVTSRRPPAAPVLHFTVATLILYNLVAHISILIMSLYIVHIYELVNYF